MTTLLTALHIPLPCYSELSSNMSSRSNEESISNRGANGKISKIAIVADLCSQERDDVPYKKIYGGPLRRPKLRALPPPFSIIHYRAYYCSWPSTLIMKRGLRTQTRSFLRIRTLDKMLCYLYLVLELAKDPDKMQSTILIILFYFISSTQCPISRNNMQAA